MPRADELVTASLEYLSASLVFDRLTPGPASHAVTVVKNVDRDQAPKEIGRFLTALLANAFTSDLQLLQALGEPTLHFNLERDVAQVVGTSNSEPSIDPLTERNPWIAEGLLHLMFHLLRLDAPLCLPKPVRALTPITPHVKRPGVDALSIHGDDTVIGICIGEAKSTESDPNGALADAVGMFREIEDGRYDFEVRSRVGSLLPALGPDAQGLYLILWQFAFSYAPLIAYGVPNTFVPERNRAALFSDLAVGPTGICLLLIQLDDPTVFYDAVSDAMREAAAELSNS